MKIENSNGRQGLTFLAVILLANYLKDVKGMSTRNYSISSYSKDSGNSLLSEINTPFPDRRIQIDQPPLGAADFGLDISQIYDQGRTYDSNGVTFSIKNVFDSPVKVVAFDILVKKTTRPIQLHVNYRQFDENQSNPINLKWTPLFERGNLVVKDNVEMIRMTIPSADGLTIMPSEALTIFVIAPDDTVLINLSSDKPLVVTTRNLLELSTGLGVRYIRTRNNWITTSNTVFMGNVLYESSKGWDRLPPIQGLTLGTLDMSQDTKLHESYGIVFDLMAVELGTKITMIDFITSSSTLMVMEVYAKTKGFQPSLSMWTRVAKTAVVGQGSNAVTTIILENFHVPKGQLLTIYITCTEPHMISFSTSQSVGSLVTQDDVIKVLTGQSVETYPLTDLGARIMFAGTVHYTTAALDLESASVPSAISHANEALPPSPSQYEGLVGHTILDSDGDVNDEDFFGPDTLQEPLSHQNSIPTPPPTPSPSIISDSTNIEETSLSSSEPLDTEEVSTSMIDDPTTKSDSSTSNITPLSKAEQLQESDPVMFMIWAVLISVAGVFLLGLIMWLFIRACCCKKSEVKNDIMGKRASVITAETDRRESMNSSYLAQLHPFYGQARNVADPNVIHYPHRTMPSSTNNSLSLSQVIELGRPAFTEQRGNPQFRVSLEPRNSLTGNAPPLFASPNIQQRNNSMSSYGTAPAIFNPMSGQHRGSIGSVETPTSRRYSESSEPSSFLRH